MILIGVWAIKVSGQPDHVFRFASEDFATKHTDSLPDVIFHGDLLKTLEINQSAGFFLHDTKSTISIATIELNNSDKRYSQIYNLNARDSRIEWRVIGSDNEYNNAIKVGEFVVNDVSGDGPKMIVSLLDKMSLANVNTSHEYFPSSLPNDTIAETPEPLALGDCRQVPCSLIDEVQNIYQIHSGSSIQTTVSVSDRIDPLIPDRDFSIINVSQTNGVGYDLDNNPSGTITANINGEIGTNLINGFIEYLLIDQAGLMTSDIDSASLVALFNRAIMSTGLYLTSPRDIRSIIDEACIEGLVFYFQNTNGQISFNYLERPEVMTPSKYITPDDLAEDIKMSYDNAPGLSDTVAYVRNVHVFSFEEIRDIGGVSDYLKDKAIKEFRNYVTAQPTRDGIGSFHPNYKHARHGDPIKTIGIFSDYLINILLLIYGVLRRFYTIPVLVESDAEALSYKMGDFINVTYPDFDLENGKNLQIIGHNYKALSNVVTLIAWG